MGSHIKLEKIVSCSSEDADFPAKNLLTCGEVPGSWLTANEGESQATVVIQLDRKYQINHLEIKNESSAFIEVLVADSSSTDEIKFQVLLSASSFMTPNESKNLLNVNRCRIFTKDKLSPSALKQTFDLVKINCTQPFNKSIKYGLACIKLTEGEDIDTNLSSPSVILTQSPGIKTRSTEVTPKGDDNRPTTPKMTDPLSDDEFSPSSNKRLKALKMNDVDNEPSTSNLEKQATVKQKVKKPKIDVPFCQLMSGVTFTISGFQNPLRSEIRSKGLQMGAKYKGDWDNSCTHLICAFPNTPKFNQVQATGTGKIITKEWIEDSFEKRELLSWSKYNLDNQQKTKTNKVKNVTGKKKRKDESNSEDDEHDSEMDDFIVDDDDEDDIEDGEDEEYDPKKDKHIEDEDEDEDLNELGPVLPSKLRDDSPERQLTPSPRKKDDKTINKLTNQMKDDEYNSDTIYDAATDDEN